MSSVLQRTFSFMMEHNLLVLLLALVLTAGVGAGVTQLQLQSESDPATNAGDTELAQLMEYIQENYEGQSDSDSGPVQPAAVYVRAEGNALSKEVLLDSLRFQRTVLQRDSVDNAVGDREVLGVANLVAMRAAGDTDPPLEEQILALEEASSTEVKEYVRDVLSQGSSALRLVPESYEPGTASAESHRMVFPFSADADTTRATEVLYATAVEREQPDYFTVGEHASGASTAQYLQNTMTLVVPVALLVILAVLAFSYRDLVDVIVGFTGVLTSVVWMFGILGWLKIPAGMSLIIGPVLIVGLSVDYGLHVFMRYREQRGPEEAIREPMARGLSSIALALGVVTVTAMVGFMSNATNDFSVIRQLAFAITLGVLSTFVVSLSLVPALKVTLDRLFERVGVDRHTAPLGKRGPLKSVLASGAHLARRAGPVVLVVALIAGSAGALAWTDLDRQSLQQGDGEIAEWKQDLPEPLAWDVSAESQQRGYVAERYRAADEDARSYSNVLIEGAVTSPKTLERVRAIHEAATQEDPVFGRGESAPLTSPLTVMAAVAAEHPSFADSYDAADTDGDGVPDQNLGELYDDLYSVAPEQASRVIHREDGTYHSMRVVVPIQSDAALSERAAAMQRIADTGGHQTGVTVTAVGSATLSEAQLQRTAESILETLVIALLAVGLLLMVAYRLICGSASLGLVTALPITLVTALVIGGMWLFAVPLTLLTALLLSLVIGIGIDYNIHVADRFAQERERGQSIHDALLEATTGTGGALMGSTLTSAGAFSALLLHPHPQFQSFGTLVVLAMITAFGVAVFVLPSILSAWAQWAPGDLQEPIGNPDRQLPAAD